MPAVILSIIFSGSFTKEESQRTAAQDAMECSAHHFAQVFNDYRQPFIHFAYTYTRNATVAEDIVMDARYSKKDVVEMWMAVHENAYSVAVSKCEIKRSGVIEYDPEGKVL